MAAIPSAPPTALATGSAAPTAPPVCVAVAAAWVFFGVAFEAPVTAAPPVGVVGMPLEHAYVKARSFKD